MQGRMEHRVTVSVPIVTVAVLGALTLGGCSSSQTGTALPEPSSATVAQPSTTTSEAPSQAPPAPS